MECPFQSLDACLDNITAYIPSRKKRSSSFLSRVAGLIHLRGSLSRIRARLRSTLRRARSMALPVIDTHLSPFFPPFLFPLSYALERRRYYSFDSPINPTVPFPDSTESRKKFFFDSPK